MSNVTKLAEIETLLFVVGDEGIDLEELANLVGLTSAQTYQKILELEESYEENTSSALHILEAGNRFVLTTKKEMASLLKKYAQSPISNHLSQAALETLSIIAYKQPIARVQVDEIRGVQSSGSIQKLVSRHLIEEKGRLETPGRPILYGTTDYFMDYFGLRTLEDLPDIQQMEEEISEEMPTDLFFERYADKEIEFEEEEVAPPLPNEESEQVSSAKKEE
jgi:segregation and condensation protein B